MIKITIKLFELFLLEVKMSNENKAPSGVKSKTSGAHHNIGILVKSGFTPRAINPEANRKFVQRLLGARSHFWR